MSLGNKKVMATNIKYYMEKYGIDRNKLCNDLNLKYMTVSDWINAKTYPRIDKIEMLANYFKINKADLVEQRKVIQPVLTQITATSQQLHEPRQEKVLSFAKNELKEQKAELSTSVKEKVVDYEEPKPKYKPLKIYGRISAGHGEYLFDEVIETIQYSKPIPQHDIALIVAGNSMEPLFRDEEIVFIKKTYDIFHGQIGAFILNNEGFLKKFYQEKGRVRLVSLNKEYKDIIIGEDDDLRLVGTVVL